MTVVSQDIREGISGLLWHAQCKQLALEEVMSFRPPADLEKMRMYHSLYLTSLQSLLELGTAMFGKEVKCAWRSALDGAGGHGGENNLCYVRELRNAIVHRGENVVAVGSVVLDQTCAVAPAEAFNRRGKIKGPYLAFAPYLRNVFAICEDAVGPVILTVAADALATLEQTSLAEMASEALTAIKSSAHMPDWAKAMAIKHMHEVPFENLRGFHPNKLRDLLSRGAPVGLALPVLGG
ncbi:MAG: hypothetical protein JWR80_8913 [Bradyrhizobium sp.]|nr:hypothetical protein [Bradyrhizobium sp.]